MTKYSKTFGEVEVISEDKDFTTIIVKSTGEQKLLSNKYANLSSEPFVKAKKVKAETKKITNTAQDLENIAYYQEMESRKLDYYISLTPSQRLEYRKNQSKINKL